MATRRFIDLSISIEPDLPSDPPNTIPRIDYVDHVRGASSMLDFFPGAFPLTGCRKGWDGP